ncbi:hypothetical protein U27_03880 [Candidatus Vecturithrix granuli]|uniref:Uncharacterized protein n=1 Tax=Vecturithrix granuli TaxID=1499967 RepID=A0A081BX61_VECG1|nr:hypothetical protein U27_03880 [Candidatus Vecturithrix granuli]
MNQTLTEMIAQLQRFSSTKMTGAVKTFPLRELLKQSNQIQEELSRPNRNLPGEERQQLEQAYTKLQEVISRRIEAAQKLIDKFAKTTPEVIALNTSVFSLMPSRDVLEDVKTAYSSSKTLLKKLQKASANVLEAVNIEIQQRFYDMSPEAIAVAYTGKNLESYRKLLKNLLTHIEVDSEIFKVYSKIIRNVIEGIHIYETHISLARKLSQQIFQEALPDFEQVFHSYTLDELASHEQAIKATLNILEQDITGRPSIVEFATQCRAMLQALPQHFISRKIAMRKTSRVLQLSHYFSFLTTETVSENATTSLMLCESLFEETREFLRYQQKLMDVSLNLKSLEEAQKKVEEGLRYRQFAIGHLFQEILRMTPQDLSFVSEKWLGDSNLLLQEVHHLVEDYLRRIPQESIDIHIVELSALLRESIKKLHEAIGVTRFVPNKETYQAVELDRSLPNLSKFYDKELVMLLRKALATGNTTGFDEHEEPEILENSFVVPLDKLEEYIKSFIGHIRLQPSI